MPFKILCNCWEIHLTSRQTVRQLHIPLIWHPVSYTASVESTFLTTQGWLRVMSEASVQRLQLHSSTAPIPSANMVRLDSYQCDDWDIRRPTTNWHPMECVWVARRSSASGRKPPGSKARVCNGCVWYDNVYQ